jgi:hypothetical protein
MLWKQPKSCAGVTWLMAWVIIMSSWLARTLEGEDEIVVRP